MKKTISIFSVLLLLLAAGGCGSGQTPSDPPWLPVAEDYRQMQTAIWEATVVDGKVQESTISFPIGGGFFKKATYSAEDDQLRYSDEEFLFYGRLTNQWLPSLFDAVNSWMGDVQDYRLLYQDLDQKGQAAFDYALPTALCDLNTMTVTELSTAYEGLWDYGVLYLWDSAGETLLWQIILTV